ncbi:hypothetical protein TIFTF001_030986 [Ficus carica]|uniref:Putative plant transposon protein domain-containing protein n=1 Tax=Ficus carica TaxID=3494 RepID=A0AA88DVI8_FICCA|nr:hypothetical protein TIFTF001_030986 [Ficus carica]
MPTQRQPFTIQRQSTVSTASATKPCPANLVARAIPAANLFPSAGLPQTKFTESRKRTQPLAQRARPPTHQSRPAMPRTKNLAHKQTGRKPKDTTTSYRTFQTEADHDRYQNYTSDRTFCAEKGFLLQNTPTWGQRSVYVRGVHVPIDEDTINQSYRLDGVDDLHTKYAAKASADSLDRVLENVCVPITMWTVSTQRKLTVPRVNLTPQYKVWYHFLKTRLMPSTHLQTVSKSRVLLLDSIISGRSIDVGNIISQGLGVCVVKKCDNLWFLSLITSLCANSGVPMFDTKERLLFSKGAISKTTIARLLQAKMAEGPSQPPRGQEDEAGQAPQAPTNHTVAASSSRGLTQANLTNSLQMLKK